MRALFWKYAYWRYRSRPINPLVEWVLIVWGAFWALVCGLALTLRFDVAGSDGKVYAWLAVGLALLAAGFARRAIRRAQVVGGEMALYRKRLEVVNG